MKTSLLRGLLLACLVVVVAQVARPQSSLPVPARVPAPDARLKADILVIVAHPDDDTGVSTYLAKAVFDQNRRVAVVFTNRGLAYADKKEYGRAIADYTSAIDLDSQTAAPVSGSSTVKSPMDMPVELVMVTEDAEVDLLIRVSRVSAPSTP